MCLSWFILVYLGLSCYFSFYLSLSQLPLLISVYFRLSWAFIWLSRLSQVIWAILSYLGLSCAILINNELSWLSLAISCYLWLSLVFFFSNLRLSISSKRETKLLLFKSFPFFCTDTIYRGARAPKKNEGNSSH